MRTRWVLLVLFWLGWVGMLAGAIVIIVQAPRCKPIPEMNWWNEGPLYQIDDLDAFSGGMEGKVFLARIVPRLCCLIFVCVLNSQESLVTNSSVVCISRLSES